MTSRPGAPVELKIDTINATSSFDEILDALQELHDLTPAPRWWQRPAVALANLRTFLHNGRPPGVSRFGRVKNR